MKILLEAFVDNNFGDNLFVHIVASRYPEYTFYMVEKEAYASSYTILKEQIPNLIVQKEEGNLLEIVDGMFVVGGDMFGNGADYSELIRQVYTVKKRGGVVAFLGNSLFCEYSKKTWIDLMVMFSYADIIVVREQTTYKQLKRKIPWLPVVAATDLAFTADVGSIQKEKIHQGLLGVSVRKKVQKEEEIYYPQYCRTVAAQIVDYLNASEQHQVHLLALSSGRFDDNAVAMDIYNLCPAEMQDRVGCIVFNGDVSLYMKELQKCEKMLCTRFHALVFAILLDKPFIPIIYEEKMNRFLDEIGYLGERPKYEGTWKCGKTFEELAEKQLNSEMLELYLEKADLIFLSLDKAIAARGRKNSFFYRLYEIKRKLL